MTDEEREDEGAGKRVRLVRRPSKKKVRLVRRPAQDGAASPDAAQDELGPDEVGLEESSLLGFLSEFVAQEEEAEERQRLSRVLAEAVVPGVLRKLVAREGVSEELLGRLLAELPRGKNAPPPKDGPPKEPEPPQDGGEPRQRRAGLRGSLQDVVAQELRAFLETVDLSGEVQKILGAMSLEVRTQIRFVPNEDKLKPEVKHKVRVHKSTPR